MSDYLPTIEKANPVREAIDEWKSFTEMPANGNLAPFGNDDGADACAGLRGVETSSHIQS